MRSTHNRRWALTLAALVVMVPAMSDAGSAELGGSCVLKGKQLWGRVQVVEHFADLDVKVVEHFADLNVRWVENFADGCGRWKRVEHFPDLKIRFVEHFADLEVKIVDNFEGLP